VVISEIDFWNNIKNYDKEINSVLIYDNLLVKELKKISNKKKKLLQILDVELVIVLNTFKNLKKFMQLIFLKICLKL